MKWLQTAEQQQKFLLFYCLIAGLTFFCTLFLPYVGEEGVYTLGAMEMLHHHNYFTHTLYNSPYGRPPLDIWLVVGMIKLLGWKHALIASRLTVALTTVITAFVLFGVTQRFFKHKTLGLLAVALFFSGDLLFRRGWLAYADPVFSLFVFLSMACLWFAINEKSYRFYIYAMLAIFAAVLTKALTVYVFYGVTALVLLWRHPNRKFLLSWQSILIHAAGLALVFVWFYFITPGDARSMLNDIFLTAGTPATLMQHITHLISQPFRFISLFLPASLVIIYLAIRKRIDYSALPKQTFIMLAFIVFINYLPYWISIKGRDPRYIYPLYPFISIALAWLIYASKERGIKLLCYWLIPTLALKLIASFWGFYYYQNNYRSDYMSIAKNVLTVTRGYPVYSRDVQFTGLSVAANIDKLHGEQKATIGFPTATVKNGFILAALPNQPGDKVYKHYKVKRTDVYLLCKGKACKAK